MTILSLAALLVFAPPDTAPARPAAMVLDRVGKVEIRPKQGPAKAAEPGDLLYPGETVAVPALGTLTVALLGTGVQEAIKPGTVVTIDPKGCTPAQHVAGTKPPKVALARSMKGLRPAPDDARKAGVGFRDGPVVVPAVTPIQDSIVASDRPGLTWPPSDKAKTYRVKMLTQAGRELWRVQTQESKLPYPDGKEPLKRGYPFRWEVTDEEFRPVAASKFSVATESEQQRLAELAELEIHGDRADRFAAAMAYVRMGAYAEALGAYDRLAKEWPDESAYRLAADQLHRKAGHAEATKAQKPSGP